MRLLTLKPENIFVGAKFYVVCKKRGSNYHTLIPGSNHIVCLEIVKVGRKYAQFKAINANLNNPREYRFNLQECVFEYLWGANEWRLLSRLIFQTHNDAFAFVERELLVDLIKQFVYSPQIENVPLELLQEFVPYFSYVTRGTHLQILAELKNVAK